MTLDPAQRSQLQKAKLAAVTRDFLDQERSRSAVGQEAVGFLSAEIDVAEVVEAGSLYAINLNGHGFVLLSESSARSLSAAMIWAAQQPAQRLTVFVDAPAPSDARTEELSRWAQYFLLAEQPIEVRVIDGPVSRRVEPGSVPEPCALPERHELLEQHHVGVADGGQDLDLPCLGTREALVLVVGLDLLQSHTLPRLRVPGHIHLAVRPLPNLTLQGVPGNQGPYPPHHGEGLLYCCY